MPMLATVLYAVAMVLGLLAAVGVAALGPMGTAPLALACTAAGLLFCHVGHPGHAHA